MSRAELSELRETWRERVTAFHASGQSGAEWCAAHEIKAHQLWYWVRRFRSEPETSQSLNSPSRFVPVQVEKPIPARNSSLLVHIGAVAIEVYPGYDEQLLRDLVETLSSPC